jgi:hypothetical protein
LTASHKGRCSCNRQSCESCSSEHG